MWILALAPIIAGLVLALAAVIILAAEFIGKGAVALMEVGWEAIRPANHRHATR